MTLEEYYRTRYANPDVWGTEGAYYNGLFNRGGDGAEDIDPIGTIGVNLNGTDYTRTGTADNSRFDQFGGGYQYDPTYGWVVPSNVASAYGDSHDNSAMYFGAGLGLAALPYMAATGLASFGGMGGGENVLNGMDFSGAMTNVDDFGYGTLTSGLEGTSGMFPGDVNPSIDWGNTQWGSVGTPYDPTMGSQQAIDGSMQSIYDANAAAGMTGYDPSLASGASTLGGSSVPSWLQNLMPSGSSLTSLLGKVAPSVLGYLGADKQADSYKDMMNQYYGMGAPYRNLLQQSYQPGFDLNNEPGFKNAMDTGLNTWLRAASAWRASGVSRGNPLDVNNAGASIEGQKYITGSLALPYLTNYRSGLMGAGQLGLGPSAQFGSNSIQAQGGKYDAIGYGLGEIFNPKPTGIVLDPQTGQFKLNTGSGF
jgi:hypothetical protein